MLPVLVNPSDTVSLNDAVALALLHNPRLAAFAWESRARESMMLQAASRPNPVVEVMSEDVGAAKSAVGGQSVVQPQTTVQLSQLLELAGKRTARRTLAARNSELAAWDHEAGRIDVVTQVAHAFIDVLVAQRMVALTGQTTQLVTSVQQSVGARVVAGVVSPIEETRANVALAAARVEANRARRLLDASRARLAATWGAPEARFRSAVGDLDVLPELPTLANLQGMLAENPDLARWAAEISQRLAVLSVEQSQRLPDLSLTGGYRRYTDARLGAFVIGASIPLPLFDRNRGATDVARNRLAKGHEERRTVEAGVWSALAEAYRSLASAHEELTVLRETVFPGSQQAFDLVTEGYRLGKFSYLEVLDAQRTLISASSQYLRAVSEYHKAVADIERLIGAPLPRGSSR